MRKHLRFSIRALLVAMAVFSFAFVFLFLPGLRFRDGVIKLKSAGVYVFPLQDSLFAEWFPQFGAYDVQVEESKDPAKFPLFLLLPNVRGIVWKSPSSQDLRNLSAFPSVESIELLDVNEDVCWSLGNAKSVLSITISGYSYSGTDLGILARFPNLAHLDLSYTNISDSELRQMVGFKNLRSLSLRGTRITDEGMMGLTTLSLTSLDVSETAITDQCLTAVSRMGSLKQLAIQCRQITEVGVCKLLQEPAKSSLRSMSISSMTTNRDGVAAITHEFPLCKVEATIYFTQTEFKK